MTRAAILVAFVVALAIPAAALAHGGEEDALSKTPARALAQQALALLAQEGQTDAAHERVDAAIESKDKDGIDASKLKQVEQAFDAGDPASAKRLLAEALAGPPRAQDEEMDDEAGSGTEPMDGLPEGQERRALDHAPELDPDRGTAEWVSLAGGLALVAGASLLLLSGRRRRARG